MEMGVGGSADFLSARNGFKFGSFRFVIASGLCKIVHGCAEKINGPQMDLPMRT